ncbi:MAG TPA: ATP-binding protein [Candidatus Babeliales bacterium]|jgi:ATP-dependent DNA helicase RecG|nr:ATP-binding protein [Candidatus Babeliales bacterium]
MKIAQLKSLVHKGESEILEFKNSTGSLSAGMQTVCAFLNSSYGGTIIFGVKDDGAIIGQDVTDKTRRDIAAELNKIEPHEKIDVFYIKIAGGRYVIVFSVGPGEKAPYTYDGRPFIRNQSTTVRMTKEEYVYLYNKNNPTLWEGLTNNSCTLGDLDNNRIQEVIRTAVFEKRLKESAMSAKIPDILKKLGLIIDGRLTNAAVILFCKKEQKQFMQSTLKLARFKGTEKTEFLDTKMFRENAFDLYDKAIDFLTFSLPVAARIEPGEPKRVEEPAVPYKVLREAITNALVHRDYSHAGGSISIAIYDDRVNITNTGSLPKGIFLKQLSKEHPSIQRNPLIAHVFYLCGRIEKWGRGTVDMIQECKRVGNPPPKYEEIGGNFSVTLPFQESIRTFITRELPRIDQSTLTDRQKSILALLKAGTLSRQQLMEKMKISLTDRTMQLELAKLMKMGLIKSEGKAKATVWSLVD